jgi:hypothetical protein
MVFTIYKFNSIWKNRKPIVNGPDRSTVEPNPVQARTKFENTD